MERYPMLPPCPAYDAKPVGSIVLIGRLAGAGQSSTLSPTKLMCNAVRPHLTSGVSRVTVVKMNFGVSLHHEDNHATIVLV